MWRFPRLQSGNFNCPCQIRKQSTLKCPQGTRSVYLSVYQHLSRKFCFVSALNLASSHWSCTPARAVWTPSAPHARTCTYLKHSGLGAAVWLFSHTDPVWSNPLIHNDNAPQAIWRPSAASLPGRDSSGVRERNNINPTAVLLGVQETGKIKWFLVMWVSLLGIHPPFLMCLKGTGKSERLISVSSYWEGASLCNYWILFYLLKHLTLETLFASCPIIQLSMHNSIPLPWVTP